MPTVEDAIAYLLDYARTPRRSHYPNYGYGLYLSNVVGTYLQEVEHNQSPNVHDSPRAREITPIFFDAAWDLCRRGILRPGLARAGAQATDDGASGYGYTVTQWGRLWLSEGVATEVVLYPGRLNQLFASFADRLGEGFVRRAQEAVQCHKNNTFLACCAMCGAAAESILLAVAVAKKRDEAEILRLYRAANGRRRVTDFVIGSKSPAIAGPFRSATGLLSYWRDDAAHGLTSTISEIEAHEAVARLLRFAQFVTDEWEELTR
jgi:hypothetical protein